MWAAMRNDNVFQELSFRFDKSADVVESHADLIWFYNALGNLCCVVVASSTGFLLLLLLHNLLLLLHEVCTCTGRVRCCLSQLPSFKFRSYLRSNSKLGDTGPGRCRVSQQNSFDCFHDSGLAFLHLCKFTIEISSLSGHNHSWVHLFNGDVHNFGVVCAPKRERVQVIEEKKMEEVCLLRLEQIDCVSGVKGRGHAFGMVTGASANSILLHAIMKNLTPQTSTLLAEAELYLHNLCIALVKKELCVAADHCHSFASLSRLSNGS
mmetsp:Transcript_19694/g.28985  ORF Transcript_19694/g.28985 Transcript_19694/m.28985 type:complete len:265 (-) Transcript_19694:1075-1869(-)